MQYSKAEVDMTIERLIQSENLDKQQLALDLDTLAYRDGKTFRNSPELQETMDRVYKNRV